MESKTTQRRKQTTKQASRNWWGVWKDSPNQAIPCTFRIYGGTSLILVSFVVSLLKLWTQLLIFYVSEHIKQEMAEDPVGKGNIHPDLLRSGYTVEEGNCFNGVGTLIFPNKQRKVSGEWVDGKVGVCILALFFPILLKFNVIVLNSSSGEACTQRTTENGRIRYFLGPWSQEQIETGRLVSSKTAGDFYANGQHVKLVHLEVCCAFVCVSVRAPNSTYLTKKKNGKGLQTWRGAKLTGNEHLKVSSLSFHFPFSIKSNTQNIAELLEFQLQWRKKDLWFSSDRSWEPREGVPCFQEAFVCPFTVVYCHWQRRRGRGRNTKREKDTHPLDRLQQQQ